MASKEILSSNPYARQTPEFFDYNRQRPRIGGSVLDVHDFVVARQFEAMAAQQRAYAQEVTIDETPASEAPTGAEFDAQGRHIGQVVIGGIENAAAVASNGTEDVVKELFSAVGLREQSPQMPSHYARPIGATALQAA